MTNWYRQAVLALGLVCTPFAAGAGVLYTNLGPGNSFIINREWDSNFAYMATSFTTTAAGDLNTILTPLFSYVTPMTFGLYTDSGGAPGALLEGWSEPVPEFPGVLTTFTSVLNPFLSSGTEYWFVVTTARGNDTDNPAWYWNNQDVTGGIWAGSTLSSMLQFEPASPVPAIELTMSGVPEPSTWLLLSSGFLFLAFPLAGRNRKRAACAAASGPPADPSPSKRWRFGGHGRIACGLAGRRLAAP